MVLAAAIAAAGPADAQQRPPSGGASAGRFDLRPPPADFGAPPRAGPRLGPAPEPAAGCAPEWACRLKLFGEIEKYGGVGLKTTALTW